MYRDRIPLERNRTFAAGRGHEGAVVFPDLRLFVVTCIDPRVDPLTSSTSGSATRWSFAMSAPRHAEVINDVAFIGQIAENRRA